MQAANSSVTILTPFSRDFCSTSHFSGRLDVSQRKTFFKSLVISFLIVLLMIVWILAE